jgi:hypothetical protein
LIKVRLVKDAQGCRATAVLLMVRVFRSRLVKRELNGGMIIKAKKFFAVSQPRQKKSGSA